MDLSPSRSENLQTGTMPTKLRGTGKAAGPTRDGKKICAILIRHADSSPESALISSIRNRTTARRWRFWTADTLRPASERSSSTSRKRRNTPVSSICFIPDAGFPANRFRSAPSNSRRKTGNGRKRVSWQEPIFRIGPGPVRPEIRLRYPWDPTPANRELYS